MTRMADGIYILADTLRDLEDNSVVVLHSARLCWFTFKPYKIVIASLFGWKMTG